MEEKNPESQYPISFLSVLTELRREFQPIDECVICTGYPGNLHSHEGRCDGCDAIWDTSIAFVVYNGNRMNVCSMCRSWARNLTRFVKHIVKIFEKYITSNEDKEEILQKVLPEFNLHGEQSLLEYVLHDISPETKKKYYYFRVLMYKNIRKGFLF